MEEIESIVRVTMESVGEPFCYLLLIAFGVVGLLRLIYRGLAWVFMTTHEMVSVFVDYFWVGRLQYEEPLESLMLSLFTDVIFAIIVFVGLMMVRSLWSRRPSTRVRKTKTGEFVCSRKSCQTRIDRTALPINGFIVCPGCGRRVIRLSREWWQLW